MIVLSWHVTFSLFDRNMYTKSIKITIKGWKNPTIVLCYRLSDLYFQEFKKRYIPDHAWSNKNQRNSLPNNLPYFCEFFPWKLFFFELLKPWKSHIVSTLSFLLCNENLNSFPTRERKLFKKGNYSMKYGFRCCQMQSSSTIHFTQIWILPPTFGAASI